MQVLAWQEVATPSLTLAKLSSASKIITHQNQDQAAMKEITSGGHGSGNPLTAN